VPARLDLGLLALVALTLLMGLANVFLPPIVGDEAFKNWLENVMEWNAGVAFTLFFAALAWLWRHTRFEASLRATA
jgi:protein-S-isoprenylcysteine O-methyltransferase Ste14